MIDRPLVSLCMPTNGVIQWVFPVLDSIYSQGVDNRLFEVIITDNGSNSEFKRLMREYIKNHDNLVYEEIEALPFINEIESYKRACGLLIKFVNHRTKFVSGALEKLLSFAKENMDERPIVYFSNGVLKISKSKHEYETFDEFVNALSYWSSWSTGMTIWKDDFDMLPADVSYFNELFPHTNVLFNERSRDRYVIDNSIIFAEINQGKMAKGSYDLYYAFGIEYPKIIENLYINGNITEGTYKSVIDQNLEFIAHLYWDYSIQKKYCSYDLSGLNNMFGKYYEKKQLTCKVMKYCCKRVIKKLIGR